MAIRRGLMARRTLFSGFQVGSLEQEPARRREGEGGRDASPPPPNRREHRSYPWTSHQSACSRHSQKNGLGTIQPLLRAAVKIMCTSTTQARESDKNMGNAITLEVYIAKVSNPVPGSSHILCIDDMFMVDNTHTTSIENC